MKFLDQAKIYLQSGNGGPGCTSFRREKHAEFGGPDGGNGGKGGDIILEAVADLNTLIDFRYQQHFRAQNGQNGMGKNRSGAKGDDLIIKVPVGTEILADDKETVMIDFTQEGQRVVFLKGGDGGFGNAHYKSATNQAPRKHTPGWPGVEVAVWLRLKLIADVGLLGLPNAGKSTFLSVVSNAKPKIADYPFTTLHPNLGVVKAGDYDFVIADIPGLIEGAHEGIGLGHQFLGHVERTSVLLHLIDATQDDVVQAYKTIRNELKKYDSSLENKEEIIVLTKEDAIGTELAADQAKTLAKLINSTVDKSVDGYEDKKIHVISAVSGEGVQALLYDLAAIIRRTKHNMAKEEVL